MKIKKIINGFFGNKKEQIKTVDEKNLGEDISETGSTQKPVEKVIKKMKKKKYKYRISSPENFKPTKHIKHGTSKLCNKIPDWAVNNSRVVIEKLD